MLVRRLLLLALLAGCGPPPLPDPDSCKPALTAGVATLALGPGKTFASTFRPFVDGEPATTAVGGQGSTMLVMRISLVGPAPPSCVQQMTLIEAPSYDAGRDSVPRKTYAQPDGTRVTDDMYIPFDAYGSITVTTTVGSLTATARLGPLPHDLSIPHDLPPVDAGAGD